MSTYGGIISGAILAGGQNKRFPSLKGFIRLNGMAIIDRSICIFKMLFDEVMISANNATPYEHLGIPIIQDDLPSMGPLTGIYSCLKVSKGHAVFFAACDMPFIYDTLVKHICDYYMNISETEGTMALVPVYKGRVQPLFGIYSKILMPQIRESVISNRVTLVRFLEEVGAHYFHVDSIISTEEYGWNPFININTPEEYLTFKDMGAPLSAGF